MKDEIFRLTPVDVRRMEFPKSMRGYDAARVDDFREQVADELERLTRANQDLEANVRSLTEQLRGFRDRDKALNDALVSAQQLRNEIRESAEREASLIVREARAAGERELEELRSEVRRLESQIADLDRARRAQLAQLRQSAERQLAEVAAAEQDTTLRASGASLGGSPSAMASPVEQG